VHERICKGAISREYQEACGGKIEPSDRDPARALEARQGVENEFAAIRVFARSDFVGGLVVDNVPVLLRDTFHRKKPPIQRDFLCAFYVVTKLRRPAIDRKASFPDPGLNFSA
jgi:hypothetical protein